MFDIKFINKFYNYLNKIEKVLIVLALGIMIFNVTLGVFYRYVLNNSITWTEELARYLMIWFGFIGMGIALKENRHVGVTVIVDMFPKKIKKIIKIISDILILIFLGYLIKASIDLMPILSFQTSSALGINMRLPYLGVLIGAIVMVLEAIKRVFLRIFDNN